MKEAFFCQFGVCVAYTTVFWLLLMLLPNVFAGIFTSDVALVDYTTWALRIFLACAFSVGFQLSCQQAFMALGQAKISLIMALLRKVFLLIPLIFLLPNFFADKAFAVFLAEPVADIIAAAVTTFMFFRFFLKLIANASLDGFALYVTIIGVMTILFQAVGVITDNAATDAVLALIRSLG